MNDSQPMSLDFASTTADNPTMATNLVKTSIVAVSVLCLSLWIMSPSIPKTYKGVPTKSPVFAPASILETLRALLNYQLIEFWMDCAKKVGGPIFRMKMHPIPSKCPIVIGDADLTREIACAKGTRKAPMFHGMEAGGKLGPSLFSQTDQAKWKPFRKGVAPAFASKHVRRMNGVCMKHVEEWAKTVLEPIIDRDEAFDPGEEMIEFNMGVICEAAFELLPSKEDRKRFVHESDLYLREFAFQQLLLPVRKYLYFAIPAVRRGFQAVEWLQGFCQTFLDAHRVNPNPTSGTVIDLIANNAHYPDDNARLTDILIFLIGGHDTTAYTIAWTLIELAKHPQEQTKLRIALQAERDEDARAKLPILHNVIQEAMRLDPVGAQGSWRTVDREFMAKDGTYVPAHSTVFLCQMLANRNPDIYERPDDFIPDRWETNPELASSFAPFALGARNCVGQSLAIAELHAILAFLCARYEFELVDPGRAEHFLTYKPLGALLKARRA